MRFTCQIATTQKAMFAVVFLLLFGVGLGFGQNTVSLTAVDSTTILPDGQSVPMWGYMCTGATGNASCVASNPAATGTQWSPVLITVPPGDLSITLTNNLHSGVPTSIAIVGQLGGGLGDATKRVTSPAPNHIGQSSTWPITGGGGFIPPVQSDRVRTFANEVASGAASPALTWTGLKPGTYLIESGTHPSIQGPMGLYGVLVVTTAPNGTTPGTAYTGVNYAADVPLLLSEIDPLQNRAVETAVNTTGFSENATANLQSSGGLASIMVLNGGTGYVSGAPTVTITGTGAGGGSATADVNVFVSSVKLGTTTGLYTSAPTVHLNGGGGTGATAVATIATDRVVRVTITNGGSGYNNSPAGRPTVTFSAPGGTGTTATGTANVNGGGRVTSITVNNRGSGYTSAPTMTLSGGAGTGAKASAALGGPVTQVTVTNGGSGYTAAPSVTFSAAISGSTTATAHLDGTVIDVNVVAAGQYDSQPTVMLSPPPSGTTATAEAVLGTLGTPTCIAQHTCYPPAVNYTPVYYMINGVAFDKTHATSSLFSVFPASGVTGSVLVRLVNAGLRMHVPSIVGSTTGGTSNFPGFTLVAEDGNVLPGTARIQSEVFMAAGKTYDVMINAPTSGSALPVFDRQLSLSGNRIGRDTGMFAYVSINGSNLPNAAAFVPALAKDDAYTVVSGQPVTVSDPGKGVIANDTNVYGVAAISSPAHGTVNLAADGTFTYTPDSSWTSGTTTDSFQYQGNGATGPIATVNLSACGTGCVENASGIVMSGITYNSKLAKRLVISPPGVLSVDKDMAGLPLTVLASSVTALTDGTNNGSLTLNADGSFIANVPAPGTYSFTYKAQNSQGTPSGSAATVTLVFPTGSGMHVTLLDGQTKTPLAADYRWVIEEDRTFFVDPNTTQNNGTTGTTTAPTFGVNFHTSFMPLIATGCVGTLSCESGQSVLGTPSVCDLGNGSCRPGSQQDPVDPADVTLDIHKRYYLSVLPGDAGNAFAAGNASACPPVTDPTYDPTSCGHGMGGTEIIYNGSSWVSSVTAAGQAGVTVLVEPTPLPTSKLAVFVFEDDFPLNGEQDAGGGVDVLAPNEPGLGGFNITIFDDAGGSGDATGQVDYDMFNQPLSNSLAGTIDPATGFDACPTSKNARMGVNDPTQTGIAGTVVTCPKYESDGQTLSPLAGQALVANMMPGRYGVVATPGADRIARGEEWLQTNTLDGQKAHDSFLKVGEPAFFQEYGPASYHVAIGFANPAIINGRHAAVCNGTDINVTGANCTNTLTGHVSTERYSRTPDERLYGSGSYDSFSFTQCYVSFGDPDGEDFAFAKCDDQGNFTLAGLPDGDWRVTVFDQWNDMLVDGLSTPVRLAGGTTIDIGEIATNQWQANIYTRTFFDQNGDGVSNIDAKGNPTEPGLALVPTNIRFRDGSYSNFNNTDLNGFAGFNEVFPLFNWYVIETDTTRYKNTGTHIVYDSGGPADGTQACSNANFPACGSATGFVNMANTAEKNSVPADLRIPGSRYCKSADCPSTDPGFDPAVPGAGSTGRVDAPWVNTYGWQGFSGQNSFIEFGKKQFAEGETGGIHGHVVYASTRPFDDPALLLQLSWEPLIPHVTINLYEEGTAADGTQSLHLVDTTQTSSFDDWAQGFQRDANGNLLKDPTTGNYLPNMSCPGQSTADLFYFSLKNQPQYLDLYNQEHPADGSFNAAATPTPVPYNSQFKCYDGMHNWNQLQPAPYDGMYNFPSVTARDPKTGKPNGTNCHPYSSTEPWGCKPNPATDWDAGSPMLPSGKYVVEVVIPPGYELVKEEDKNILIGDNFIAPVTVQFPGLGSGIFILPDQAELTNPYNAQNSTQSLGVEPRHEGDTGSIEEFWPCVGQARVVPDFISLFPGSAEVAPFAGATRHLCDRKEITLQDQSSALAKFYLFTSTHVAAHFTGVITDDFTSEFDPFSPQFGEKFSPPDLPISVKDWAGNEVNRIYADHWGTYDGLNYSTWEVNPPNPTGYSPTMMVMCMNDAGTQATPDALFNSGYSDFCYELPFMPGQTQYMDTPVTPTSAFSEGYNHPDCAYPDTTPAIATVTSSDAAGPWVSAAGHMITINALGDQLVNNYGYSGPSSTTNPFNQKKVTRHYGFGTTAGTVTIGGKTATLTGTGWSDGSIQVLVPSGVAACAVQQQSVYGGSNAQCGQLVVTAANGKSSVDTVTITIGGKTPTVMTAGQTIQSAINSADPGDLIIVPPGVYQEILLMWKPVRLQGVGAAASVINANTHPAGKLDPWRAQVNCLFGLSLNGQPRSTTNPFDSTGGATCGGWTAFDTTHPQVDRLPLEGILGWDTTVNGNLAQLLQEPTLMGAYEGAGITVLGKGVKLPAGVNPFSAAAFGTGNESAFPAGTTLLSASDCLTGNGANRRNPYPSNFYCNPSSIDGLSITDSSQGGGGIFVHAWAHYLQIANNRVYNNTGTLTGGITVGQGESPDAYLVGDGSNVDPGSCQPELGLANTQLPYCFDWKVNVHNNAVTLNSSIGDELFSSTPAGAGGVTICTGADNYLFNYNWVCGNLSTGDGGGLVHLGYIQNGDIEHNTIIFNQSTNPTVPTNGGGVLVMGAPPDGAPPNSPPGTECGSTAADADCPPGLSDGSGPNLVINANLVMGNGAESGSGGGLRFQNINGTEVLNFPALPVKWNNILVTNNIIANNLAGWDGAGISLQDAMRVDIVNNTIVSNDTTASAGVLFNTLGAPLASSPGDPNQTTSATTSAPQPAGLVAIQHSSVLQSSLPGTVVCPAGHANCKSISDPVLYNNIFWQNRSFYIGVGALSDSYQQNIVTLFDSFSKTAAPSQPAADASQQNGSGGASIIIGGTGACGTDTQQYWDIGVRGDTAPGNHGSGFSLATTYSILTNPSEVAGGSNDQPGANPRVLSEYCNGSRTPPEAGMTSGWQVPPGISDATVPNPIFNLTPAATVDEGNNWINISWGPLSLVNPKTNTTLGNYAIASDSAARDQVGLVARVAEGLVTSVPSTDFFGNARDARYDIGAVEFIAVAAPVASVSPTTLNFGNVVVGATSSSQTLTLSNTGGAALTTINVALSGPFSRSGGTCGATLAANSTCSITVAFTPTASGAASGSVTITGNATVTGSPVALNGTGVAAVTSATLTPVTWTVSHARNCPGTGLGVLACLADPVQTFTLTNTGNVTLTGIGQGTLGGTATNVANYAITALGTSCGLNLGILGNFTSLAPGATCTVTVQFRPQTSQAAGLKQATVSVTDAAGTQTSTLNGTAQ